MSTLSDVMGAIAPGQEQISVTDYRPIPGQTNGLGSAGEVDELDALGWLGGDVEEALMSSEGMSADLGAVQANARRALRPVRRTRNPNLSIPSAPAEGSSIFAPAEALVAAATARKPAPAANGGFGNGLLSRIVAADASLKTRVKMQQAAKRKAAQKSPIVAMKLAAKAQKTSAPGASVARGVINAMAQAAKNAKLSASYRAKALAAMKHNDKRLAAAYTVKHLELARTAATQAQKAEKTRLAISADTYAKTFEKQADTLREAAAKVSRGGINGGQVAKLTAQADQLAENAKKLRAASARTAELPDTPAGLPTPQRIADIANKFNVRTSFRRGFDSKRALISVLGEAYDAPLAQADDYEGALGYYGGDLMGRLAADIEYGNYSAAVSTLYGLDSDLGEGWDIVGKLKSAGDAIKGTIEKAKTVADKAYKSVVKPVADKLGLSKKTAAAAKPPAAAPAAATAATSAAITAADSAASSADAATGSTGDTIFGLPKMVVYGGGAVAVLGAAWFLTRKK